jgi:hypothetical protein
VRFRAKARCQMKLIFQDLTPEIKARYILFVWFAVFS